MKGKRKRKRKRKIEDLGQTGSGLSVAVNRDVPKGTECTLSILKSNK
jgi:hypothetical protein